MEDHDRADWSNLLTLANIDSPADIVAGVTVVVPEVEMHALHGRGPLQVVPVAG